MASIVDHSDALSDSGSDRLFEIRADSSAEIYALTDLLLTYKLVGGSEMSLNFELTDSDEDLSFGGGDVLIGIEPGPNILSAADAGAEFEVILREELEGNRVSQLWEGIWTADE